MLSPNIIFPRKDMYNKESKVDKKDELSIYARKMQLDVVSFFVQDKDT